MHVVKKSKPIDRENPKHTFCSDCSGKASCLRQDSSSIMAVERSTALMALREVDSPVTIRPYRFSPYSPSRVGKPRAGLSNQNNLGLCGVEFR